MYIFLFGLKVCSNLIPTCWNQDIKSILLEPTTEWAISQRRTGFYPRRQGSSVLSSPLRFPDEEGGFFREKGQVRNNSSDSHGFPYSSIWRGKRRREDFFVCDPGIRQAPHSFDRKNEGDFFGSGAGSWIAAAAAETEFTKKVNVWNVFFPSEKFLETGLGKCFLVAETETACCSSISKSYFSFFEKWLVFGRFCVQIHLLSVYLDRAKIIILAGKRVGIEPNRNIFFGLLHTQIPN